MDVKMARIISNLSLELCTIFLFENEHLSFLVSIFYHFKTKEEVSPRLYAQKRKKNKRKPPSPVRCVALGLQQDVPAADLLSSALLHVLPVELLLLSAAVLAQSDPAHHFFAFHAAAVVDGDEQRNVGQLEQRHLEDERLLVYGVGLATTHRRLTPGDLLTHRVQQSQTPVSVWTSGGEEKR